MIKNLKQQHKDMIVQVIYEFDDKPYIRVYKIDYKRSHMGDDDDPLTTIVIFPEDYEDVPV